MNCAVITILDVAEKSYIVLLPLDESGQNEDGEVWFYGYSENEENPDGEPELRYIEDDDEYGNGSGCFDEYLDNCEFDELIDPENKHRLIAHRIFMGRMCVTVLMCATVCLCEPLLKDRLSD